MQYFKLGLERKMKSPENKSMYLEEYRSIYPNRGSENLSDKILRLSQFEQDIEKPLALTEQEKVEFFAFEKKLGEELESINSISPENVDFYLDYFASPEGRHDFESIVGINLDDRNQEVWELVLSVQTAEALNQVDSKERAKLAGRSRKWAESQLFDELAKTRDAEGNINPQGVKGHQKIKIFLTPQLNLQKINALREFKDKLKKERSNISSDSKNMQEALIGILDLYQFCTNTFISSQARQAASLKTKESLLGSNVLTDDEKEILKQVHLGSNSDLALSRYDKMIWGASSEHDDHKNHPQISKELSVFVDEYEKEYFSYLENKNTRIKEKGLDPQKLQAKNITAEQFKGCAEEILAAYNLLKDENNDQSVGWQVEVSIGYSACSVNGKLKLVKLPAQNRSAEDLIAKLAHEVEGHALQHNNKSKIPLKILEKLGTGRSDVLAECGAMNNEDATTREAFGFATMPKPNYIRAMERRLLGGSYVDCVAAFYQNSLYGLKLRLGSGDLLPEEFEKACNAELEFAINRTRRLFPSGASIEKGTTLADSKNTAYLEQVKLYREFKQHGLQKYIFLVGMTLDALLFFMKIGIIKSQDIDQPKDYTLKIWERMKKDYVLG